MTYSQILYDILLYFVDEVYEGKAIERFWFLETVARMPYFAYSTSLHLYETLGWWRTGTPPPLDATQMIQRAC